uniref:Uncharacterized protein n=1 Tax=Tanacetum cinerariifolium TaxID=118510 RepID=A0A6L2K9T2_TANCI|nr:hypothetical protein [Tanacetum cinerariifolium]
MMAVKDIVNRLLEEVEVESFWEEGDDFGVDVLHFHTCFTDILGFLEKLKWWFDQDIDDEGEEDEEVSISLLSLKIYSFEEIGVQVMTFMRRVLMDPRDNIG